LSDIRHMPDRMFVLIRKNFQHKGKMIDKVRRFEQPKLRPQTEDLKQWKDGPSNKKFKPKKQRRKLMATKTRRDMKVL